MFRGGILLYSNRDLSSEILTLLAQARRRIVGQWRIAVLCRRTVWERSGDGSGAERAESVIKLMLRRGDLTTIAARLGVYRVDTPFAQIVPTCEEHVVQEANPWAVFSHLTALAHHGLTTEIPNTVWAISYENGIQRRIPLGTEPEDWAELEAPSVRTPHEIDGVTIEWTLMRDRYDFGHMISYVQGLPVYMTDVERTLLDGLRLPARTGGIGTVLRAWRNAVERWNLDRLVDYTERHNSPVLRQRVGYVLEEMGVTHPRLEEWRQSLQRGGSMKLVADAEYSEVYSERWNLSLNVPDAVIAELRG